MERLSRAAFLPHFGDPLAFAYWFGFYQHVWAKEVDWLYVFSSNISEEGALFIENLIKESGLPVWYQWQEAPKQHGDTLAMLTQMAREDLVMFIEDDAVIFKPGAVDEAFRLIEEGSVDAVGSARGSCSRELIEAAHQKWDFPAFGDVRDNGCNFWPNFFFAKRSDLLKTDLNFNAVNWKAGEYIEMFNIVAPADLASDTFGWGSLQLRDLGLRFAYVPQYHGHPDDPADYEQKRNLWDGKAKWVHHGSLSTWKILFDDGHIPTPGLDKGEITRRLQWWQSYLEHFLTHYPNQLEDFTLAYGEGIGYTAAKYGVSFKDIKQRQKMYWELMR